MLSEVELRRIFDVCKRWTNSGFACIYKEKCGSMHEATWATRIAQNVFLASCIEIYYSLQKKN